MSVLHAIKDFVARNRGKLGGLALALWVVAAEDQSLTENYPRLMRYAGAAVAYVMGSGLHKSDSFQRDKQGK